MDTSLRVWVSQRIKAWLVVLHMRQQVNDDTKQADLCPSLQSVLD